MKSIILVAALMVTLGAVADGKTIYEKQCAKCHGADGKGQTKMGIKLEAKDYTQASTWEKLTDAAAIKSVKEGYKDKNGKEVMKPTEGVSDADAKDVIEYMKKFKK